jgi:hypothetical protein
VKRFHGGERVPTAMTLDATKPLSELTTTAPRSCMGVAGFSDGDYFNPSKNFT